MKGRETEGSKAGWHKSVYQPATETIAWLV